jgi:type III secretion inner rod protein HrpB2
MTIPVQPVLPPDASLRGLSEAFKPQPAEGPSMEQLTQRFHALMTQPGNEFASPVEPNAVTEVLSSQENLMRQFEQQAQAFQQAAPAMSMSELTAATIEVQRTAAMENFQLSATTSLASGSNKGLQSLLKNS